MCGRLFAALLVLALTAGCTSLQGGARVEGEKAPIVASAFAFPGLLQSQGDSPATRRYIFNIHGMGMTLDTYNAGMATDLEKFGYKAVEPGKVMWVRSTLPRPVAMTGEGLDCGAIDCTFDAFGKFRIERYTRTTNGVPETMTVYTYYWHEDLWRIQFPYMKEDLDRPRALINDWLKTGIVDEGFSDAVAYLSPMRTVVLDGLRGAICSMIADAGGKPLRFDASPKSIAPATPTEVMQLARTPAPGGGVMVGSECLDALDVDISGDTEFNFVSHSLGSRMLLDALSSYAGSAGAGSRLEANRMEIAAHTRTIFMAANQIPLLAIGAVTPASVTSPPERPLNGGQGSPCQGRTFFDCRRSSVTSEAAGGMPLWVVSFFDPDDVLGYRANGAIVGVDETDATCVSGLACVRFTQVIHRNTPVWLFALALPGEAHDKELDRSTSSALIYCGATFKDASGALQPRMAGGKCAHTSKRK